MKVIRAYNIECAYEKLLETVLSEGRTFYDERGDETFELLNTIVIIDYPYSKNPQNIPAIQGRGFWSGLRIKTYINQFMGRTNDGFAYTYGNRLREHFGLDQVEAVIKRLKNSRETRRATLTTWDPLVDAKSNEVPCMILIDFKIRSNQLHTTALWRSHDVGRAWYPNVLALAYLAETVMYKVGCEPGPIVVHSISAHVRLTDFEKVDENGEDTD
ncbi:MAG TPA: thymidylate synthase [Methanothermobacter sp.]|nr:thymidylate synthase [Methanothermobacter sp.]